MKIGTKSVLFGAHCFFLHPWFVAEAWRRLYGFPWDPRLWFAFFLHDIGYIGKPNMDGAEGEEHPFKGAAIMGALFGSEWEIFTMCHSRYLAKSLGLSYSKLCVADKLASVLTPSWLYLPMVRATGEIHEYMANAAKAAATSKAANAEEKAGLMSGDAKAWHMGFKQYMTRWVEEHKDLKPDEWTRNRAAER